MVDTVDCVLAESTLLFFDELSAFGLNFVSLRSDVLVVVLMLTRKPPAIGLYA